MISIDRIVSAVAPSICIGCGYTGALLCDNCLAIAGEPPAPRCAGCRTLTNDYKTCASCKNWLKIYSVTVANAHEGLYEQLVHSLKFDMKRDAVQPIASLLAESLPSVSGELIVCPIPTAPSRVRARGLDHTKLISKQLLSVIEDTHPEWKLRYVLARKTNARQLGSSRKKRIEQMNQEFYVKDVEEVDGKNVLLIDDVITTGATLAAAAKTLKDAGAKRVYAAVFAQK